jgi:hypothetical protein
MPNKLQKDINITNAHATKLLYTHSPVTKNDDKIIEQTVIHSADIPGNPLPFTALYEK